MSPQDGPASLSDAATDIDGAFWRGRKKQFGIQVGSSFVMIQLLFLGVMSYLFGSIYQQHTRVHNLDVLLVDYDQGVIGQSLRAAGQSLAADSFPTLVTRNTTDYPDVSDVVSAVRRGDYWGAVYTHAHASDRLAAALQGGDAASGYNASAAITYVWNEIRYPTIESGMISSSLETLIAASRAAYTHINGTQALKTLDQTDDAAVAAFLNPIQSSNINIKPSKQSTKTIYNTIPMVMSIIMQFFFLMAVNGIASALQLYSHIPFLQNAAVRLVLSLSYTFIGSLCMSGYLWAFKENWEQPAGRFFLMWMVLWLYQHINFLAFDVATTFIPMSFISFFTLSWVIANVTSTIAPFELAPGFYRWSYALPSNETWAVLMTIWSGGAVNRLYRALPILFAWCVVLGPTAMYALKWRCANAAAAAKERADEERRQAAEMEKMLEAAGAAPAEARRRASTVHHHDERAAAAEQQRNTSEYFPNVPAPFEQTLRRVFSA